MMGYVRKKTLFFLMLLLSLGLGTGAAFAADEDLIDKSSWTFEYNGTSRASDVSCGLSQAGSDAGYTNATCEVSVDATAVGSYSVSVALTGNGNDITDHSFTLSTGLIVNKKSLSWTNGAVEGKSYDGTATATIATAPSLVGVIGSEDVTITTGTASFTDANVGPSISVTATGWGIEGSDASNYEISGQPTFATAAINPAALTISSVAVTPKTYDGTPGATVSVTFGGLENSETLTEYTDYEIEDAGFSDPNVNVGIPVTGRVVLIPGGTVSKNYSLADGSFPSPTAGNITVAALVNATHLTITGIGSVSYDGDEKVVGVDLQKYDIGPNEGEYKFTGLNNLVVSYEGTSGTTYAKSTDAPREVGTYAVTLTTTGSTNFTDVTNHSLGTLTITAPTANLSLLRFEGAVIDDDKTKNVKTVTYDGTSKKDAVAITHAPSVTGLGAVTVTYKNATGESDVTEPTAAGTYQVFAAVAATDSYLAMTATEVGRLVIEQAEIPTNAVAADYLEFTIPTDKVYNGSAQGIGAVTPKSTSILNGLLVTANYDGETAAPTNAGTYAVTAVWAGNDNVAAHTFTLGNYTIARKQLAWKDPGAVKTKTYDGTTDAEVETDPTLDGVITDDNTKVSVARGTVEFTSALAGTRSVTATGFGIAAGADGDASANYNAPIAQPTFSDGTINKKMLTIVPRDGVTITKVYDGEDTLVQRVSDLFEFNVEDFVGSQRATVGVAGVTANYETSGASDSDIDIEFTGNFTFMPVSGTGASSANYDFTAAASSITDVKGRITKRPLRLDNNTFDIVKEWDGNELVGDGFKAGLKFVAADFVEGEVADVDASSVTAYFNDGDAGYDKPVWFDGDFGMKNLGDPSPDKNATAANYNIIQPTAGEITGSIIETESEYTIAYDGNGATGGTAPLAQANVQFGVAHTFSGNTGSLVRTGYTLAGWNTKSDTSGTLIQIGSLGPVTVNVAHVEFAVNGVVTLYAHWRAEEYTITYTLGNTPDGVNAAANPAKYTVEMLPLSLAAPTRDGYAFNGWTSAEEFLGVPSPKTPLVIPVGTAKAITVVAVWEAEHTITLNVNDPDAENNPITTTPAPHKTGAHGLIVGTLPTLTKPGYTFNGWFTHAEGGSQVISTSVFGTSATIYAQWTEESIHTITFNLNYEGAPSPTSRPTQSNGILAAADRPTDPSRAGWAFNGWFTAEVGGIRKETNAQFTFSETLYAQWVPSHTITFNADGGTVSPATGVTDKDGKLVGGLPTPTRSGHVFVGWYNSQDGGILVTNNDLYSGPTTLYARWVTAYTVTFNANGGTVGTASASTNEHGRLAELPVPSRAGWAFAGWFTAQTGGTRVDETRVYTANTSIYAQWEEVYYTITFDANGGEVSPSTGATGSGGRLGGLPTPTRTGYTFANWFNTSAATGGTQMSTNTVFTRDSTIYARWNLVSYGITYSLNNGAVPSGSNPTSYNVETETFTLVNPTRANHTFAGWTGTGITEPQQSVTINAGSTGARSYTANWTANVYTVTFNANGGTVSEQSAQTGSNWRLASLPEVEDREGYTFGGWHFALTGNNSVTTSTTFSRDTTIIARWNPVSYTITYELNGGSGGNNPTSYNIETPTFTLRAPTRADFEFTGWTGTDVSTPQTEVTVERGSMGNRVYAANWAALPTYRITFDANYVGGVNTQANTGTNGRLASLPQPNRPGYTLVGWFTEEEGGILVTTSYVFNEDAVLYAQWVESYTVTFNANGGSVSPATAQTNANGSVSLPTPTRSGFAFTGWTMDQEGGVQVTSNTVFGQNTTIYAQWVTAYTVTFNANGGTVSPASGQTTANGTLATLPTPTRANYNFNGWFTALVGGTQVTTNTTFDANATIFAQWTEAPTSVAAENREIVENGNDDVAVIGPVATAGTKFSVGPNPVSVVAGSVNFYYTGRAVRTGSLTVYDAAGNVVRKINVSNSVTAWDLKDARGRTVSAGTYLVRGVVTGVNGEREKVSSLVSVR